MCIITYHLFKGGKDEDADYTVIIFEQDPQELVVSPPQYTDKRSRQLISFCCSNLHEISYFLLVLLSLILLSSPLFTHSFSFKDCMRGVRSKCALWAPAILSTKIRD
jgi:hypothetical protein